MTPVLDALATGLPLASGAVGVLAGVIVGVILSALFVGARGNDEVLDALDIPPTEEERSIEDAVRAAAVRGFMEGTVCPDIDLSAEHRLAAARLFAAGYIERRRKLFESARATLFIDELPPGSRIGVPIPQRSSSPPTTAGTL